MQIEKREIVKCVLLSIVTCGIYGIIWVIKIGHDAVKVKDPNDAGTTEVILMILFPFIGFYLAEKKFSEGLQAKGIPHNDNSVMYLLLGLFGLGIVNYCLMQSDLNKLVDNGYATDPSAAFMNNGQAYNPNPNFNQQYNQNGNQQYNPNGNQQYNPNAAPQYNPNAAPQYNPNAAPQYNPNANQQQYNPNVNPQYNPQNNNYPGNNSQDSQEPQNPQY